MVIMVGWMDKKLGQRRYNEQKARHPPEDQRAKQPAKRPKGRKSECSNGRKSKGPKGWMS